MTFEELARSFEVEGLQESPAEVHGLFSGRVAGGERLTAEQLRPALLESLESDEEVVENAFPDLQKMYTGIVADFEKADFGFNLLLPAEDVELTDRVVALSQWCEHFLSGLGDSGLRGATPLSEEVAGAIRDMAAIAQVGFEGSAEEGDESDLMELEEYVRVAAMMIYTELNSVQKTTPGNKTLH